MDRKNNVKVLSWNIHGDTSRGLSRIRNESIGVIVERVNPNILLLQEPTTRKLIGEIKGYKVFFCNQHIAILYDSDKFSECKDSDTIYSQVLDQINIRGDFNREEIEEIEERTCMVWLKHKKYKTDTIFMTFHNFNNRGPCTLAAEAFLDTVTSMGIVAGVDFNCKMKHNKIPEYIPTCRRQEKHIIDYFIIAGGEERPLVTALNIADWPECREIDRAFDHDPLLYMYPWPVGPSCYMEEQRRTFWEIKQEQRFDDLQDKLRSEIADVQHNLEREIADRESEIADLESKIERLKDKMKKKKDKMEKRITELENELESSSSSSSRY